MEEGPWHVQMKLKPPPLSNSLSSGSKWENLVNVCNFKNQLLLDNNIRQRTAFWYVDSLLYRWCSHDLWGSTHVGPIFNRNWKVIVFSWKRHCDMRIQIWTNLRTKLTEYDLGGLMSNIDGVGPQWSKIKHRLLFWNFPFYLCTDFFHYIMVWKK